ncbi:hypothetical protein H7J87_12480 [Mycolicibacterium wolinskyi]|uniref:Uncharacterized protein n=1 Tax=Mycolicibacterium wolinskyi TaxID=59750 RepID=A0A1X2FKQ3_9MYCO|nr:MULTISPECIES: hypothetical protein [Mycolicibacterium]MCV7286145.1 hypothetical protein [Mycolicibacterium wolinskyi]MCV7296341.1 hypothetical protein [Mycolicibacterium goodii]ORX18559.1 hypothetical protein AWC31_14795 [Mycolicibacterium wolinskyi]
MLIAASDPTYGPVRRYLMDEHGEDFATVRDLVDRFRTGVKQAAVEAVAVVDGDTDQTEAEPYRITHGDPVEEVMLAAAIRLTNSDADLAPLGAFLRRLERNPSQASRSQLFGWLKAGGFTLTTEGLIVGYKSVRGDGRSAHAGREPVTVQSQDGSIETVFGRVPYPVGATVWMPRDLVNEDRDSGCSVGLHVGTFGYAEDFSEQMLVVLVDPADVVSVPTDSRAQKMRVCRLYVAARHDGEQISETVIDHIRTVPDFEASGDYSSRPENAHRPAFGVAVEFDSDDQEDLDEVEERAA